MASASGLETQLQSAIDTIEKEIAAKQKELAEAQQNMKDYKNNKTVVEKLLALATPKKTRKPRTKKDGGFSVGN